MCKNGSSVTTHMNVVVHTPDTLAVERSPDARTVVRVLHTMACSADDRFLPQRLALFLRWMLEARPKLLALAIARKSCDVWPRAMAAHVLRLEPATAEEEALRERLTVRETRERTTRGRERNA